MALTRWLAAVALCTVACGGDDPIIGLDAATPDAASPDADVGAVPRIEPAACLYAVPAELGWTEGVEYACGTLVTVKDRDADAGRVALHFIRVFSAAGTDRATIYLDGGPGGNGARFVTRLASLGPAFRATMLVDGDLLVLAQRGTSLSSPSLADDWFDVDLGPYNTGANADDVDDLRAALGYAQLNLLGISYGSRLGLEVLRRHGEHVRAASIGGIVPAQTVWPAATPASFYGALLALDASCGAGACGAAFGDLPSKFLAGIYDLAAQPLEFDYQGAPMTFDAGAYAQLLFSLLYARSSYPWLPMMISDLAERRTDRVGDFIGDSQAALAARDGVSYGLYYAVVCGELFNPPDLAAPAEANAGVPQDYVDIYGGSFDGLVALCPSLQLGPPRPALRAPVSSAVPTLVDSGALDPITPPAFADVAAPTLSSATVVVVPDSGHGALLQSNCGIDLLGRFFAEPTAALDTSCVATVQTDYVLPAGAALRTWSRDRLALELADAPPLAPR